LSFEVGDYVYLKVLPMRRLRRFKVRGKLTSRFIGPFKITKEREEEFKAEFSNFFSDPSESQDEIHFRGGRFVTPQNSQVWNVTKIH
jgi:hypothetical protein